MCMLGHCNGCDVHVPCSVFVKLHHKMAVDRSKQQSIQPQEQPTCSVCTASDAQPHNLKPPRGPQWHLPSWLLHGTRAAATNCVAAPRKLSTTDCCPLLGSTRPFSLKHNPQAKSLSSQSRPPALTFLKEASTLTTPAHDKCCTTCCSSWSW